MTGILHFKLFLLAGILLNMTPGADTLYILGRSVAQGRRAGLLSVFGISSGVAVHTLLAALGLSVVLARSALAFQIVKTAGALYLGYLGLKALLARDGGFIPREGAAASNRTIYLQGLLTNVLNPKVALFFLAFLPQFVDPGADSGILPFLLLGATFFLTGTVWCLCLAYFSSGVTGFLRRKPRVAAVLNKACGGLFLALGARLLLTER
ncbi:Lysine exporter protein (LYSE/YGGA) [Desulfovibrio sp. X2]|uniref:LysE family translocator n=1 Tax=Desulfovibrio sp. X2 TaxID=941449 RepID=UPI000358BB42|nr:LysE family translocator [Desulfovibrio sp. X2]EPR40865.1 Lysine exporter protein (LYSE/YGGA) [Desulfovibrio sp. X2]